MTIQWLEELRSGLEAYGDWVKPQTTVTAVSCNTGETLRFDTENQDWRKSEIQSGSALGEALFELLTVKFNWEANQLRKKKEKQQ